MGVAKLDHFRYSLVLNLFSRSPCSAGMSATKTDILSKEDDSSSLAPVPRDARLVSLILASMGVEDAEPAVLVQLLEFAHRK